MAGTSSFASTALQTSSVHMLSYFFFIFSRSALKNVSEHECYRALQPAREVYQTINLLRQWDRNIRPTLVEVMELFEASCRQQD